MKQPQSKKILKNIVISAFIFTSLCATTAAVHALNTGLDDAAKDTGLIQGQKGEPAYVTVIANIVSGILGIVGVIFFTLMIYGGMVWMTSAGNEQRITTAKKILTTAIIGLVVVIAGFSISYFVIRSYTSIVQGDQSVSGSR